MKNFKSYINEGEQRVKRIATALEKHENALRQVNLNNPDIADLFEPTLFNQNISRTEMLNATKSELATRIASLKNAYDLAQNKMLKSKVKRLKPIINPHQFGYNPTAYPAYNPMDINNLDIRKEF